MTIASIKVYQKERKRTTFQNLQIISSNKKNRGLVKVDSFLPFSQQFELQLPPLKHISRLKAQIPEQKKKGLFLWDTISWKGSGEHVT